MIDRTPKVSATPITAVAMKTQETLLINKNAIISTCHKIEKQHQKTCKECLTISFLIFHS